MNDQSDVRLVADIGGTNARFGIVEGERIKHIHGFHCAEHPTLEDAIRTYVNRQGIAPVPTQAAVAVAAPISGPVIEMTNHPWRIDVALLGRALQLRRVVAINDLAAAALSLPFLDERDLVPIGGAARVPAAAALAIGVGTGLGVAGLIPVGPRHIAVASEGGHATMPSFDSRETALLEQLRSGFDHVSAERVLSGIGLKNLHAAVAAQDGTDVVDLSPEEIVARAESGSCRTCAETVEHFSAMLGGVAGNLALTFAARAGVYLFGSIAVATESWLTRGRFRERFEAKGRFASYLARIPVFIVRHPTPALLGLPQLLRGDDVRSQPAAVVFEA